MAKDATLTILQVNDSHGYLDLHEEMFFSGAHGDYRAAGGYGRLAALIKAIRASKPGEVLTFDCGDTIHGTFAAVKTKGQALVPILNAVQFDAMTAHWEFAYGPERLKEVVDQLSYPMLAINCYDEETDELVFDPYRVVEAAGLRIGVIGIAATIVDKVMPKSFSKGVYFTLGNEELPGYIEKLRNEEAVDLVVLISHLGFPQEMKLAREVDGIDVLLSGHTHNRIYRPAVVNNTIVIQSGCHGSFLGRLDLDVENGEVVDFRHDLIAAEGEIDPDAEVQQLVDAALKPYDGDLHRVVGQTVTPLNRYRVMECTMDNLLLQSLLAETGAQLAFSNGWRYGAPISPGPITVEDLWHIIPVNPPISTCRLTGDELRAMLEENLQRTFAADPWEQMGGYVKRCMGLTIYFKIENPPGERIEHLFVDDERVKPDDLFDACFVTTQGVPAKYGSQRQKTDVKAIAGLKEYIKKQGTVNADLRGIVVAI